jgi:hypothetical protein
MERTMSLDDISTEMLIKLRQRFQSGHSRIHPLAAGIPWMQEFERKLIEALEGELRRRLS